ncbi:MAG: translation initiation factor IF-2 N-terminal domain-containing protein, partial [Clostridiales bacterium]|nr:translation initiation factor IF-2 N-terminal domain-containing protein [Clostridiales bacterium]
MPTMRVYELAKEMEMNSKALLDTMIELGLPMKNHMSTIPGNEVNRIRAMVMKHLGDPNAEPIPRPPEKKEKTPLSGLRTRSSAREHGSGQDQGMQGRGQARPGQTGTRAPGQGYSTTGQQVVVGPSRPAHGRPGQSRGDQGRTGAGAGANQGQSQSQGQGQGRAAGQQSGERSGRPSAGRAAGAGAGAGQGAAAPGAAGARRQPGESLSPQEAQELSRARREPGESLSPQEAQELSRARREPGESLSPQEAQELS